MKVKGKYDKERIPVDTDENYTEFINSFKYPPEFGNKFYTSSVFSYCLFLWVGKFINKLLHKNITYLDFPPLPDERSIRKYQLQFFSYINLYLARYGFNNRKRRSRLPSLTFKTVCLIFGKKKSCVILFALILNLFDFVPTLLLNNLFKSLSPSPRNAFWSIFYTVLILLIAASRVLVEQHISFYVAHLYLLISSSISYTLFRLGISKRKEYQNCKCNEKNYAKIMKGNLYRNRKNSLYYRRYNIEMQDKEDNICSGGIHAVDGSSKNSFCPAQQKQPDDLTDSMYTFFIYDSHKVANIVYFTFYVSKVIFSLSLNLPFIYNQIGKESYFSLLFIICNMIIISIIEVVSYYLLGKCLPLLDLRIAASYKLITNISSIILQGLEDVCKKFVFKKRLDEIKPLFFNVTLLYISRWLIQIMESFCIIIIFFTFLNASKNNSGVYLDPKKILIIIHSVKSIQITASYLPSLMQILNKYLNCLHRIDSYLFTRSPEQYFSFNTKNNNAPAEFKIYFENASFAHKSKIETPINTNDETTKGLNNVNLMIDERCVVVLCGKPSSGKTSLIKAILGELILKSGKMYVSHLYYGKPIFYLPQRPFISSGTFMSVIVSDYPFDPEIYNSVVAVTEFEKDVASWEEKHYRIIEDNGSPLSSGQITRLSLARTLYAFLISRLESTEDTFLLCLDDLFFTLDLNVSCKIFHNLYGRDGIFAGQNVCIIMTIDSNRLEACWNSAFPSNGSEHSDANDLTTLKWIVCELDGGSITKICNIYEYIGEQKEVEIDDSIQLKSSNLVYGINQTPIDFIDKPSVNHIFNYRDMLKIHTLVYKLYLRFAGYKKCLLFLFIFLSSFAFKIAFNMFIINWSYEVNNANLTNPDGAANLFYSPSNFESFVYKLLFCSLFELITAFLFSLLCCLIGLSASQNYHNNRILSLMSNRFMISNFTGKLLTEFTMDQFTLDTRVHSTFLNLFSDVIHCLFNLIIFIYVFPFSSLMCPFIILLGYYVLVKKCLSGIQYSQLALLDSLSGVNLSISQGINGSHMFRAFRKENDMISSFLGNSDYYYRTCIFKYSVSYWGIYIFSICVLLLLSLVSIFPMIVSLLVHTTVADFSVIYGVRISNLISLTSGLSSLTYQLNDMLETICSLFSSYTTITNSSLLENKPIADAPHAGGLLSFNSLTASYKSYCCVYDKITTFTPIKSMNATVDAGDIIAIVGRTGSGKTSILKVVKNMVNIDSGSVTIDGVPNTSLSPEELKEVVGTLSLSPFYFEGWTLCDFIDPFHQYSFEEIKNVLGELGIVEVILSKLSNSVAKDSENALKHALGMKFRNDCDVVSRVYTKKKGEEVISFTDTQLCYLSFSRLILGCQKYKVILIDEPPNFQDYTSLSPFFLKNMLNKFFGHCAVLLVTHEYNYAKISNKIWVICNGRIIQQIQTDTIETQSQFSDILKS